jgi:hypothetical protein
MNFDVDVFVSYAHLDDAALSADQKGWVSKLHETLDRRLGQLLGKPARIWRDPKLHGNDVFADSIVEQVQRAAVLVSIVSPRYVKSEWTTREVTEFCKAAALHGGVQVHDKSRIFKVLKTPVPLDQQCPPLPSLLGYEFFVVDPDTGNFREFDEQFGDQYRQKFLMKLDDLAQDLTALLEFVESPNVPDASESTGQGIVYLAVTTHDLQEQQDTIRRDLQQHGYTVLPAQSMPTVGSDVETAVRADLARSSLSIHLVGKRYSLTPEGSTSSLIEIQNELAIERAEHGGFNRLLWIPPGLQVDDPRQQQVIARLRADPRGAQDSDLLETPLEDLRTVIHETLERPAAKAATPRAETPSTAAPSVYFLYDERDTESVSPWADLLFNKGLEVIHPAFKGDIRAYQEENLRTADAVVIFFGSTDEVWVRRKFSELQKIPGYGRTKPAPAVVVCLLPPQTPEKQRFRTHDATVIAQYDGPSADSWVPLIARLKG